MITLPYEVAKMITIRRLHPVTAWRSYYRLSEEALANLMGCSDKEIEEIETSNLHLKKDITEKLCHVFGIVPDALNIPNPRMYDTDSPSIKAFMRNLKNKARF